MWISFVKVVEKVAKAEVVVAAKVSETTWHRIAVSHSWLYLSGGRGRGRGRRGQRPKEDNAKQWVPVTKLGRLVNDGKIRTLEEIYLFSLPVKVSLFTLLLNRISHETDLSRRLILSIDFCPVWKMKFWKSCPFRNRPVPVNVPGSRLSLSSVTVTVTLASVLNAQKK